MPDTVAKSRLDVPLKMLRHGSEPDLKKLQEDGRRAEGHIVERAIQVAGYTKGQACAELALPGEAPLSASQLSAWIAGTENSQTWRFDRHPRLGPALVFAKGEALGDDLAEVSLVVRFRRRGV